jgi:hypothetical protein
MANRIVRCTRSVIATQSNVLAFLVVIESHFLRGHDHDQSVPSSQVCPVEAPDAILAYEIAEVPRHDGVDLRDRSDRDMRRVIL